ncbi:MAG: hypothetical protein E7318_10940 [Clostridiales bacterium]|nr:hypothetical protein [Clostridiales bacterium]
MESLHDFHARVDGFQRDSLPHDGPLTTKPLLVEKVAPDGGDFVPSSFRPFFGNTMIFDLPAQTQLQITRMQLILHHRCGAMLAEPLTPDTLHMTLHDLLNGVDEAALHEPVRRTGEQAKSILAQQRAAGIPPIRLTSTLAFNMTCGSVALGFAPDTEADCAALMAMHAAYQDVVTLSYPLTPHVTLAYYRPGSYDPEEVAALAEALEEINALAKVHIAVDADCLHYYTFEDMNTYIRG